MHRMAEREKMGATDIEMSGKMRFWRACDRIVRGLKKYMRVYYNIF